MPNRIVVTELGGPEVLKYEKYELPKKLPDGTNGHRLKIIVDGLQNSGWKLKDKESKNG